MNQPWRVGLIGGIAISIAIGLLLALIMAVLMQVGFVGAAAPNLGLTAFSAAVPDLVYGLNASIVSVI